MHHRTLIRAEAITPRSVWFIIPAWEHSKLVGIPVVEVPSEIRRYINLELETGPVRLYAVVDLNADHPEDLNIKDWELPK